MSLKRYSEPEAFSAFKTARNFIRRFYPEELISECILRLNSNYWKDINLFRQYPPWFLLLIIKWTVLYGDFLSPDRRRIKIEYFNKLINLIHDLDGKMRLPNQYSNFFIFFKNLSFQQFWLQEEPSFSKIARQKILFGNLTDQHTFQKEIYKLTNLTINEFIELSFMLLAKFKKDNNENFVTEDWFKNVTNVYSKEKINNFFKILSQDIYSLKKYIEGSEDRYKSISYEFYEQSPLKQYPFLYHSGKYFCYSPIILNCTIQNYIYDTLRKENPQKFMNKFGPIFEKYVDKLIEYGNFKYFKEHELKMHLPDESKMVDFIIHDKNAMFLVDAKGVEMSNLGKVSHLSEVVQQQTKTSIIKGINQGFETISQLKKIDSTHELNPKEKEIYLLIITFKDLYLGNGTDVYENVAKEKIQFIKNQYSSAIKIKNIYILSIDDFEVLIQYLIQNKIEISDFFSEVVKTDSDIQNKRLMLRQHIFEKCNDLKLIHFQEFEFQKLFNKLKNALRD